MVSFVFVLGARNGKIRFLSSNDKREIMYEIKRNAIVKDVTISLPIGSINCDDTDDSLFLNMKSILL